MSIRSRAGASRPRSVPALRFPPALGMRMLALLALAAVWAGIGQASTPAPADSFLHQYAATYRFRLGRPSSIRVTPEGDAVLFLRSGPRDFRRELWSFDPASKQERQLASAEAVLQGAEERLSAAERARRERMRLAARGIAVYDLSRDGKRVLLPLAGRVFILDRGSGSLDEIALAAGALDPRFSPDGTRVAFVRDGNLWVADLDHGTVRALTSREGPGISWGDAEFVAQEEMGRFHGYWWSPDGRSVACQRTDVSEVETLYIVDPRHPEREPGASAYPRPGKPNADVRLFILPLDEGSPRVEAVWDRVRYPYLASVEWGEAGPLTILVQNREQTEEILLDVDAGEGGTRTLLTERDEAWINLDETVPRWLADGRGFLWSSEREGEWRLELRARDGAFVRALTPPGFGYRSLIGIDGMRNVAWVRGGADPREIHVWRIPIEATGGAPEPMSLASGIHDAVLSRNGSLWVHVADTMEGERSETVISADGTRVGRLVSRAESPVALPRLEFTTLGDPHRFHAVLVRPRDFDPRRRYPVLVDVYGGPGAQVVQANPYRYLIDQWLADRGFVVVLLDGRGTPGRGRDWERALRGSFLDVPLADQVAGLAALGARYPELDLDRAGVFGWSYGGYLAAAAVMSRPDVYKAAVAAAPVTDWLDYDTHYTERYLGLPGPFPEAYERSSVLSLVDGLERPLLLVHGTDDDNVYFTHSLKLCEALHRAGKTFEFLPLGGLTHMVADPRVTERLQERIADFLKRELGEDPCRD